MPPAWKSHKPWRAKAGSSMQVYRWYWCVVSLLPAPILTPTFLHKWWWWSESSAIPSQFTQTACQLYQLKKGKWTFDRQEQETSAPSSFSIQIHACVFIRLIKPCALRGWGFAGWSWAVIWDIQEVICIDWIKACGSWACCRGDSESAASATSPRNNISSSFTMSCLLALAACGNSQKERRKRRDKHNASETR